MPNPSNGREVIHEQPTISTIRIKFWGIRRMPKWHNESAVRWQRLQPRNYPRWQRLISSFWNSFISITTVVIESTWQVPISMKQHCPRKMLCCKICETAAVSHGSSSDLVLTSFYVHQLHIEDESWVLWYLPHSFAPIPTKGESGSTNKG